MGLGKDSPGTVPDSVKKLFEDLGDEGGWRRVIFCTGSGCSCSWLRADAAATALNGPFGEDGKKFTKKKATFVLLEGDYEMSLSMVGAQMDIYGINDRLSSPTIKVPKEAQKFLRVDEASRVRLRNLNIVGPVDDMISIVDETRVAMKYVRQNGHGDSPLSTLLGGMMNFSGSWP